MHYMRSLAKDVVALVQLVQYLATVPHCAADIRSIQHVPRVLHSLLFAQLCSMQRVLTTDTISVQRPQHY
jgi:hypothetical protein